MINAILLAAESKIEGEVYNVGGGSRISVNELIAALEEITGEKARLKYIEKQKGDVRDTGADLNKIKQDLGWKPTINIHAGLKNYIKWYKDFYK